ncbi:MAG: hypothetical protein OXU69_07765 [Gemmatimonadota bacterium]|nr:hypothetical protein [Gemmatimonadota bacterium]
MSGKLELEYEGEMQGARRVVRELVSAAAGLTFEHLVRDADCESIVEYFESGGVMQVSEDAAAAACVEGFGQVPGLLEVTELVGLAPKDASAGLKAAACEVVLEGLVANRKISRMLGGGYRAAKS